MRLLFLTDGISRHDRRFIAAAKRGGWEVWVGDVRPLVDQGARVVAVLAADDDSPVSPAIAREARDLRVLAHLVAPDLVHAGPLTTAGYLAASAGLRPLVTASWGFDVLREAKRNLQSRARIREALERSDAVIVDSDVVRSVIDSEYGPSVPVISFPWGTDLDMFRPRSAVTPRRDDLPPTIVTARAWEPMYRVADAIRAFAYARGEDRRLRLRVFGTGSQADAIHRLVPGLGLADETDLAGTVSERVLAESFANADVYLSMSEVDGSSVTLLQALASGMRVVCSDIPGNREWVSGSDGARLVPVGDWEAGGRAILELARVSPPVRQTISRAHRKIAESRADWTRNQASLLRAYELALTAQQPQATGN